ncbi:MAG: DUF4294 domain-containing protein [Muribaculaceae bacterium]|nr:DUF4294 domain-containing protein [Muribaculaceae bacterium]
MNRLTVILLTIICATIASLSSVAQERELAVKPRYVQEQFIDIDELTGDTLYHVILRPITVFPELKFKNKKQEEYYWRTVRDVKKALPYAKLICRTLTETYEYIETLPDTKAREKHLKEMEKEVFDQYKPELKKFTRGQAKVLVKLIQRETNQSSYEIIKAFLGSFRAGFWQAFGKMFGVSLKGQYNPQKNENDALIERICIEVEQGTL